MLEFMRNFESLGNNCEFGFVLSRAGVKDSSMFKWTLIEDHEHLLAALEGRLEGVYEAENLTPRFATMVRDRRYDLCFHTSMPIKRHGGELTFGGPEAEWRSIYERERAKFQYLASTFLKRLEAPAKIYVYRSNIEVPTATVRKLLQLLRKSGGRASLLIMKQADAEHAPGTVIPLEEGLYEGYLGYLSTSSALEDIDYDAWFETCRNAWSLHASLVGLDVEVLPSEATDTAPLHTPEGFDPVAYLLANPDVAEAGMPADIHYLRYGWKEGRSLT